MLDPVIFLHRLSDNNIGDQLCSPYTYFSKSHSLSVRSEVHIPQGKRLGRLKRLALRRYRDTARVIIIGGGGLLGNEFFRKDIEFWCGGPSPKILWGAGHNNHDVMGISDSIPDETHYGALMPFAAVGLRDYGPGFTWVPCASCMHPELGKPIPAKNSGVIFALHRDLRGRESDLKKLLVNAPTDYEVVFNDEPLEVFFGKLRNASRVVTNSYHAAYWATLLKKPIVAIGGGTKVRMLKHGVPLATSSTWKQAIDTSQIYLTALEECRDRNSDFNEHVRLNYSSRNISRGGRRYTGDAVRERSADFSAVRQQLPPIIKKKVPRIVHFIFGLSPNFGGKPFNIMHYIAVKSVAERFKPDKIIFHYQFEPDNDFYHRAKPYLTLNKVIAPDIYKGRTISHFAHKADIIRLQVLHDLGGIYLDLDTITVSSFDSLLDYSFSIGQQGQTPTQGLCNAVMACAPKDSFLTAWLAQYENFDAEQWDRFSVKLPYLMWRSGKFSINVEPYDRFHWPLWDESSLKLMFEEEHYFNNAICHHLWESKSFNKYFSNGSFHEEVARIKKTKSTYARLAREFL